MAPDAHNYGPSSSHLVGLERMETIVVRHFDTDVHSHRFNGRYCTIYITGLTWHGSLGFQRNAGKEVELAVPLS